MHEKAKWRRSNLRHFFAGNRAGKGFFYSVNGKIAGISLNGTSVLTNIRYQSFGPVTSWTWSNGTDEIRSTDLAGQPVMVSMGKDLGTGNNDQRNLAYDVGGLVRSITSPVNSDIGQWFAYDGLGRLIAAQRGSPIITSYTYGYDLSGNRNGSSVNGASTVYSTSGTSNRLLSLSGMGVDSFGYDNAGNLTTTSAATYGYDGAGRKVSATIASGTWTYVYNALGQRVKKSDGTSTTYFVYDEFGHLLGEYDAIGHLIQETVWLDDLPVLTLRLPPGASAGPSEAYYVYADQLGTPRQVLRPTDGIVVWSWESEAFGQGVPNENPQGIGVFSYNLRLPGQYFDKETGLNYNFYRDYDPSIGRYIQSDPIGLAGGINTYGYVGGNPMSYTDPLGLRAGVRVCVGPLCAPIIPPSGGSQGGGDDGSMGGLFPPGTFPGNTSSNGGPMSTPDPAEAAAGNQVDTAIQQAYNNYASNARMNRGGPAQLDRNSVFLSGLSAG